LQELLAEKAAQLKKVPEDGEPGEPAANEKPAEEPVKSEPEVKPESKPVERKPEPS